MQTHLELRYAGPAVEGGTMDVYQVSANMIAFSDFVLVTAKALYGDQVQARAQVSGFGRGSFATDIVFNIIGPAATVLGAVSPKDILNIIKDALDLYKFLKGEPPKSTERGADQMIHVVNNSGSVTTVRIESLTVVMNEKAGEAAQKFIADPLIGEGIDSVKLSAEGKQLGAVERSEASYFHPIEAEEPIADTTYQIGLAIEGPEFRGDTKWRFYDGNTSFLAAVLDRQFLAQVEAGETFAKGDVLIVDLRVCQFRKGVRLSIEREVITVHKHLRRPEQSALLS